MKQVVSILSLLATLMLAVTLTTSQAQSNEFRIANQYMQQQNYDSALPILRELHSQNPGVYTFYDHLAETLINLKRYDEAIDVSEQAIDDNYNVTRTRIKLAEIYHISGDAPKAAEIWDAVLNSNDGQIQVYHSVASSMVDRREYSRAIEVYIDSREQFGNPTLFINEIANAYMQSGQFEKAVKEYYAIITETPQQMGFVQQRFLRMRNDELYSIASLELEDYLIELDLQHPAYSQLYQLLSWLLIETEEYRRAFIFARQYESRTEQTNFSLFSLGNRLRSAREYEIAAEAYMHYVDTQTGPVTRAMEETATTYIQWARYLDQQGIGTFSQSDDLRDKAYRLNETIVNESPNYNRIDRVLSSLIELSLDHFKDADRANRWYRELTVTASRDNSAEPFTLYSEGRIALFNEEYATARQALTRADRATEDSNLSEKARYYLSLSDFFAGDFEFAEVQLKSLERRTTSYFANNAIQLGMWIKNGMRMDSTGTELKTFSRALQLLHTGNYEASVEAASSFLNSPTHPFSDDMMLQLAGELPARFHPFVLTKLQTQIRDNQRSPLRERLMWERAELADQLLRSETMSDDPMSADRFYALDETMYDFQSVEERFFNGEPTTLLDRALVESMYEDILLEFPEGFYAHYAREKLQQPDVQTL